jgi:hypothetical protein
MSLKMKSIQSSVTNIFITSHIQTTHFTSKLASTMRTNYHTTTIHSELNNPNHQGGCTMIQFGPATSIIS